MRSILARLTQRYIGALLLFLFSISSAYAQLDYDERLKPFYHGVASGDPLSDRVIIWTRVTPESEGPVDVKYYMATDVEMTNVVTSGTFMTDSDRDYTVKIDVTGLEAGTTYYYMFEALDAKSIIGRTRTAPEGGVDHLRFAVVSCSNYQAGYFSAYGRIADRADLDAVIHLGDYIYEYSATGDDFYGDEGLRNEGKRLHFPDKEILTLEDYRNRYSQYRLDPDLRRAHQQHPFITVWDDHESANDAYEEGAENHNPGEGEWTERKAISRQVYSEWIPIRGDLNTIPLYRTIQYGDLMDLIMIDTRLEARELQEMSVLSSELYNEDRTILGETQKQWLKDQLSNSTATWKVVGNQVIFSDFNVWWAGAPGSGLTAEGAESLFLDIWDGYPAERDELINFISDNDIDNTVILTGDFHSSFAYDVALEPIALTGGNPLAAIAGSVPVPVTPTYDPVTGAGSVAIEFATPSVNSANFDENTDPATAAGLQFQINRPISAPGLPFDGLNPNPNMKYTDLIRHGYFILDVKPERTQANYYYVNDILTPDSGEAFDAAFGSDVNANRLNAADENMAKADAPDLAPDFPVNGNFSLQLLHASDLEGGVDAIDNAPNFAAIIDKLEDSNPNTLRISAGDNYIPGPFFNAAGDGSLRSTFQSVYQDLFGEPGLTNIREGNGRLDISIMNVIGFDASAIGNHEFDAGPNAFFGIIATDIRGTSLGDVRWLGAQFPYLSANLDFSNDPDLLSVYTNEILPNTEFQSLPSNLEAAGMAPKITPATIIERSGELIGIVGASTQLIESITSVGDVSVVGPNENDMEALAGILQPVIDELVSEGINKVIVVSHLQQFALEEELISLLSGVDVVIAGGSDVLMAQEDDMLIPGDVAERTYPLITMNADGDPAAVVGIPGEYSYVGRLAVEFDENGILIAESANDEANGVYASLAGTVADLWGSEDAFAEGTKGELVQRLTSSVEAIVTAQDGNIFGKSAVFLEGRREFVRTEETNLGNLTADANLAYAQSVDPQVQISIKNGGGIRAAIGEIIDLGGGTVIFAPPQANPAAGKQEGEISQLDIVNSLRFNNGLTLLTLTAEELLAVVEHGFAASGEGNTPGQFPQIGGMRVQFDVSQPSGDRVQKLELIDSEGNVTGLVVNNGTIVGKANRTFRIVTLNFLADGGDSYPFPTGPGADRIDLTSLTLPEGAASFAPSGSEQDALAEYLAENFSTTPYNEPETMARRDRRIFQIDIQPEPVPFTYEASGAFWSEPGNYRPLTWLRGRLQFEFGFNIDKAGNPRGQAKIILKNAPMYVRKINLTHAQIDDNRIKLYGTATINMEGEYTFMIDFVDGEESDLARIIVKDAGDDELIYDSQFGDPEEADPTTEVFGFDLFFRNDGTPITNQIYSELPDELNLEQELSIYPNPVNDLLHIRLPGNEATVRLMDMRGSILFDQRMSGTGEVNTSGLENGVYLLQIETAAKSYVQKIIKQ